MRICGRMIQNLREKIALKLLNWDDADHLIHVANLMSSPDCRATKIVLTATFVKESPTELAVSIRLTEHYGVVEGEE